MLVNDAEMLMRIRAKGLSDSLGKRKYAHIDSVDYRRDWVVETGDAGPHIQDNTDSITRHLRSGPGISE